jgi:predicted RNase H-like nuclease (RuvC/YqgF family)
MEIKSKKSFPTEKRMVVGSNKPYADLIKNYNDALKTAEGQTEELIADLQSITKLCSEGVNPADYINQLQEDVKTLKSEKSNAENKNKELERQIQEKDKELSNAKREAEKEKSINQRILSSKNEHIGDLETEIQNLKDDNKILEDEVDSLKNKQVEFKKKVIDLMKAKAGNTNPVKVLDNCIIIVHKSEF